MNLTWTWRMFINLMNPNLKNYKCFKPVKPELEVNQKSQTQIILNPILYLLPTELWALNSNFYQLRIDKKSWVWPPASAPTIIGEIGQNDALFCWVFLGKSLESFRNVCLLLCRKNIKKQNLHVIANIHYGVSTKLFLFANCCKNDKNLNFLGQTKE